jgi:dolichyl-phosphate-mannose--protein O-mannosyl transferase
MVGMFVTALVGLYTVEDLWEKFGDLKMPLVSLSFSRPVVFQLVYSAIKPNIGWLELSA